MSRVSLLTVAQAVALAESVATARGLDVDHTRWLRLEQIEAQRFQYVKEA